MSSKATTVGGKSTKRKRSTTTSTTKTTPRRRVATASKGVRFQSRGAFKCVKVDGASCAGVHPALLATVCRGWSYDVAKRAGTLTSAPNPPARLLFAPSTLARNHRRLPYSREEGVRFDKQVDTVVDLHNMQLLRTLGPDGTTMRTTGVPLCAFWDPALREVYYHHLLTRHVVEEASGTADAARALLNARHRKRNRATAGRFRALCLKLMPETDTLLRFLAAQNLTPVATQTPVANATLRLGTRVDLVVRDASGHTRVIENKLGCGVNFGRAGLRLGAPFTTVAFSTHHEHLLQTLVTHRLYKHTFPAAEMGLPLLLRVDTHGLHVYTPPRWAIDGLPQLMQRLARRA
jgi:hypothetical protein